MSERDVEDAGAAHRAEAADERGDRPPQEAWQPVRDCLLQEQGPLLAIRSVRPPSLFFIPFKTLITSNPPRPDLSSQCSMQGERPGRSPAVADRLLECLERDSREIQGPDRGLRHRRPVKNLFGGQPRYPFFIFSIFFQN